MSEQLARYTLAGGERVALRPRRGRQPQMRSDAPVYIPPAFAVQDRAALRELMRQRSFAALVTASDGVPVATHLPLLFEERGAHGVLMGHLARANPQWRVFDGQREALVIFNGPHAYVSPAWYETHPSVPTWNYMVGQVHHARQ